LKKLEKHRIPCSAVNSISQALSDPQVLHRNMVVELRHPDGGSTRGPGNPIKLSRTKEESFSPAPLLGANTDSVMSELLGLTATEIEALKAQGAIG
jgi:CoA:oxalate CoA-transferase